MLLGYSILRQDGVSQFHVRGLEARVIGADLLHGRFQIRAANAAVAGDEAARVVLAATTSLWSLKVRYVEPVVAPDEMTLRQKLSAMAEPTGRESTARVATAYLRRMMGDSGGLSVRFDCS